MVWLLSSPTTVIYFGYLAERRNHSLSPLGLTQVPIRSSLRGLVGYLCPKLCQTSPLSGEVVYLLRKPEGDLL
nr:hypothetical protein Cplu_553 [Cedratvirus plubellavi]